MIRKMMPGDIDQVLKIERASFSDPWSYGSFLNDIYSDIPYDIVCEENGEIIGYASCWMMFDEAHLANIAVREDKRHLGVGKKILSAVFDYAREIGLEKSLLEVRVSNTKAVKLYESMGYKIIFTSRKYYEDNNEDAYVMECKL